MALQKQTNKELFDKIISEDEDVIYSVNNDKYAQAARMLLKHQKKNWPMLSNGYDSLKQVKTRDIEFDGFKIKLQYNPKRIFSTNAKTDEDSIKERKCFLCYNNLPPEQKGILYGQDYIIIGNPFPIFEEHFTLTQINHFPQAIKGSFKMLLSFAKDLSKYYSVIYNGPKCGASAPDHLHFQGGTKMFLPIEAEIDSVKERYGEEIFKNNIIQVYGIDDSLRRYIVIESKNNKLIKIAFANLYNLLEQITQGNDEPLMNIICGYDESKGWRLIIFLRSKHRPSHYYEEGSQKILLSPGVADMGGVCILPLEKDFENMNKKFLTEIFNEIGIGKEYFNYIKMCLNKRLVNQF